METSTCTGKSIVRDDISRPARMRSCAYLDLYWVISALHQFPCPFARFGSPALLFEPFFRCRDGVLKVCPCRFRARLQRVPGIGARTLKLLKFLHCGIPLVLHLPDLFFILSFHIGLCRICLRLKLIDLGGPLLEL